MGSDRKPAAGGDIPEPFKMRVAPSVEHPSARLRPMDWMEAQAWCNFVLHRPTRVPIGTEIAQCVVRPEAPVGRNADDPGGRSEWTISNRATHRCEIRGPGRALRIKQFLYDWAPPACDHPSLWMSPEIRPAAIGNEILWFGTNYLKLPGSSIHRDRTMIEFSTIAGDFADHEIRELVMSLEPVDEPTFARIQATSLAQLSYQSRHASDVIAVPVGYWAHKRAPATLNQLALPGAALSPDLMGRHIGPGDRYQLDSVFLFGDEQAQEVEYVYDLRGEPGRYIRVLVWETGAPRSPGLPPARDRQACSTEMTTVSGRSVYHAYLYPELGPHEAMFELGPLTVMVLAKPAPGTDAEWFKQLITHILTT
jgi:hypothetical protein